MHRREDIDAHFADELDPGRVERMRRHLVSCGACRAYYDQQARLMRALHGDDESSSADEVARMEARVQRSLGMGAAPTRGALVWRWGLAAAGAASLALGMFLLVWLTPQPSPWREVGGKATAVVAAKAGTRLKFRRGSRYRLLAEGSVLELARGKVFCRVKPNTGGFAVHTPDATVKVVGTAFVVERQKESKTQVSVLRGKVEVAGGKGEAVLVAAGQRCQVAAGKAAGKARRLARRAQRSEWDWFWRRLGKDLSQAAEDIGDLIVGD